MDFFFKCQILFYILNSLNKSACLFKVYVLIHECLFIYMNLCVFKYNT